MGHPLCGLPSEGWATRPQQGKSEKRSIRGGSETTMRNGQSSSLRLLRLGDYIYIAASCIASIWQAWCWGSNTFWVIPMGLPFALTSYAHSSFPLSVVERPDWKRMFVLWAGMPVSLIAGALTIAGETGIMYAVGFGVNDLPLYTFRLLIGEAAACLAWAKCLQIWSRHQNLRPSRNRLLRLFAV